jgi:3-oxoacyl-[acyl-carrier protein] reductase
MKSLASEYSERNIQINAVSPSMVETSFLENIPGKLIELASEAHPLKRNAVPHDIAPLIKYLLSDESNYITGINIPICGGVVF